MVNYYLQITLTDNTKAKEAYLASDVLQQVHHFHTRKMGRLAVAFPAMKAKQQSIGSVVRIFGELSDLEAFFNMKGVSTLIGHRFYRFSSPAKVPEQVESFQSYVRDRRQEKKAPRALVREEERAIRRAMEGKVTHLNNAEDLKRYGTQLKDARSQLSTQPVVGVKMTSASNGRAFFLNIAAITTSIQGGASQAENSNSYGLSSRSRLVPLPCF